MQLACCNLLGEQCTHIKPISKEILHVDTGSFNKPGP